MSDAPLTDAEITAIESRAWASLQSNWALISHSGGGNLAAIKHADIAKLIADLRAARAEVLRLREAAIWQSGSQSRCKLCNNSWHRVESQAHYPGCPMEFTPASPPPARQGG